MVVKFCVVVRLRLSIIVSMVTDKLNLADAARFNSYMGGKICRSNAVVTSSLVRNWVRVLAYGVLPVL
jgi:hypothetical protein